MKNLILTGGTRGIGRAILEKFSKNNYNIAVIYKNSDESANEIEKTFKNVKCYKCDISKSSNLKQTIDEILNEFKTVDVLINNAGISSYGLLQDTTDADFDELFNINVKGTINTTKYVLPFMINQKEGVILNISSMWGEVGASYEVIYSASKGAINSFTKALAKEVGMSNIRVNAICPGVIKTDMIDDLDDDTIRYLKDQTPLGRIGTPKDVAETCFFLASESSSFITGALVPVNGGFSI